jgi:hypothetical protein
VNDELRSIWGTGILCHHGTARPRIVDGGDVLLLWRVAANIFNKQSRMADNGWYSSFGVGRWAKQTSQ